MKRFVSDFSTCQRSMIIFASGNRLEKYFRYEIHISIVIRDGVTLISPPTPSSSATVKNLSNALAVPRRLVSMIAINLDNSLSISVISFLRRAS